MEARFRQFRGGYRFDRFAGAPGPEKVAFGIPGTVRLSLAGAGGTPTPLLVRPGLRVRAGQMVAQGGTPPSSPVIAPVSGTVVSVSKSGDEIEIAADGSADLPPLDRRYPEWPDIAREKLEDALYVSGLTGYPAAGIPTRRGSSTIGPDEVEHVIVDATYADLWSPRLDVLLSDGMERLCSGMAVLLKLFSEAGLTVVVDRSEAVLAAAIREIMGGATKVLAVPSRYPLHHEAVLVPAVLGRRIPAGSRAIDRGVLILDLQTVMQVHDVIIEGMPPVERVVALAGAGFARPGHVVVRLGTPIGSILQRFGAPGTQTRLVLNSALSGQSVTNLDRGVDARCLLLATIPENPHGEIMSFARPGLTKDSFSRTFVAGLVSSMKQTDTNLRGEPRACLSCGFCEEVCPAGIMPNVLHRYVQRDIIDDTILRYRITDCIDCNLCSYVCPSKIPVAGLMARGKTRIAEEGLAGRPASPAVGESRGGTPA